MRHAPDLDLPPPTLPRRILNLVWGRPLATSESHQHKIGIIAGVAAIGLDGLGSAAYGPEAALAVLSPFGHPGHAALIPVFACILIVLSIVAFSYAQTIAAYPVSGGAYSVAKHNLGRIPSLAAAGSLMIDYVLNVAVAIAAGTAALVSAFPPLHPHTLELALGILAIISLINLRGTYDAGLALILPTYAFIAVFLCVLSYGVFRILSPGPPPDPLVPPVSLPASAAPLTTWVLLRAFASGCSAMTGIEAVSNSVTAFKDPAVPRARGTLFVIVGSLGLLLTGIVLICRAYDIGAVTEHEPGYQSVLSQVLGVVVGRGPVYYIGMASLLAVLCFSANTSFVGFPRLCRLLAQDKFLPEAFAIVGHRLVYSAGILFLAACAALILIVFRAMTEHLVPLFAIGAVMAFTLSQAGMTVHWLREHRHAPTTHVRASGLINFIGAAVTAITLVILIAAKFTHGAWFILLALPALVLTFHRTSLYYKSTTLPIENAPPLQYDSAQPPLVLVPIGGWNKATANALAFALRLSPEITAIHISQLRAPEVKEDPAPLRQQWEKNVESPALNAGFAPPRLVILPSPYRRFLDPILEQVRGIREAHPHRLIAIVIPELVRPTLLHNLLHTVRSERLRSALLRHADRHIIVITVPWQPKPPRT